MSTAEQRVQCKQEPGVFAPVINRARCEGKEDCVRACPYEVFEMRKLGAQDCRACGLCAAACPEDAITLARVGQSA